MPAPVQINVVPKTSDVQFDFTRTLADIQGEQMSTINPYGFHEATRTQGFASGAIRFRRAVKFGGKTFPDAGAVCIWYDEINLNIEIEPKVVIAKEVYDDKCLRKAVLDHEMKHVYADRQILNKYSKIMGKRIYEALKQRGFVVGPIPAQSKDEVMSRMSGVVSQVLQKEQRRMEIDRDDLQTSIDSREEYERVSALCKTPAEAKKTKRKYSNR